LAGGTGGLIVSNQSGGLSAHSCVGSPPVRAMAPEAPGDVSGVVARLIDLGLFVGAASAALAYGVT
jgi:hypothetical protein